MHLYAMYAAIKLQGSSKLLNYRFLAHGLTSVSYSQRGSDTNRCGTPAQSDRFTLHCQPRDHVFWQCSTYWYRNNRFIKVQAGITVADYNYCEAWRHMVCGNTMYIIYLTFGLDSTKYTTAAERRGDGAPLHRDTAGTRPSSRSTAQSTLRVQLLLHLA